jgi:hypothetical protein
VSGSLLLAFVLFIVALTTWNLTKEHIANKFIILSESERMDYMLKLARDHGRAGHSLVMEARRRVARAQSRVADIVGGSSSVMLY